MAREIKGRQLSAAGEPPERVLDKIEAQLTKEQLEWFWDQFWDDLGDISNEELFILLWHAGKIDQAKVDEVVKDVTEP